MNGRRLAHRRVANGQGARTYRRKRVLGYDLLVLGHRQLLGLPRLPDLLVQGFHVLLLDLRGLVVGAPVRPECGEDWGCVILRSGLDWVHL